MMDPERLRTFLDAMDSGNEPWLNELEQQALQDEVPIIRKDTQRLLRFLLTLQQPKEILEVGCAVGFSALLMAQYSPEDTRITTIEKYEKRIPIAKANFAAHEPGEKITLLEGDATEILKTLESDSYDLLFMDAAKGQYINFLPECIRVLKKGGLLISDNVLQDGDVIESRFAVTRRNRTIHARMREYLFTLTHHEQLQTVVLDTGDGMTLSIKLS